MAGIYDYSTDPNLNTTVGTSAGAGVFIGELCPAANLNDGLRGEMADIAAWLAGGALFKTPNSGTTGGVRVAGNATSGNAILQFVDSTAANQWGYIVATATGGLSFTDGSGTARPIGYRNLPFTAATAGRTLALTDVGMCIPATGAINVPLNSAVAFAVGDTVAIYNNTSGNISITASGGVTLRLGGSATTGTRTLAQRGLVVLLKVATDEWVAMNGGIS